MKWIHTKKYKGKIFNGSYERKPNGQRIFNLIYKSIELSFESYQAAKLLGWKKI